MGNIEWAERGRNAWMGGANRPDLVFASGHGSWLVDVEGREYLDFVSGWAVCALGHAAPEVADALREQAGRLVHCSPGYWNPQAVELAERLKGITGMDRVFLGCTGAEANECAIKLARKWGMVRKGGAFRIVSTWKGFHGRTLATMAATGKSEWMDLFGPGCPGFDHVEFGDLAALEASIDHKTCAVMLEPIQGEGGVIIADEAYLRGVRELCDRHGILMIADEVQTGLGRCGAWLACDVSGVRPDIVTLGKGLGGGAPVSACATRSAYDLFEPGDQGGTFTYHPLGCTVALAVLDAIESRGLLAASRERGARIEQMLFDLAPRFGLKNIRGAGLLRAFDLPGPHAAKLVADARDQGLLLNAPKQSTIRLCPALTITEREIGQFGTRFEAALSK